MKIIENKYAQEIRAIRAWLGLSQSEFAKELGLTQRTVCSYENGKTIPSVATWDKIKALKDYHEADEWI